MRTIEYNEFVKLCRSIVEKHCGASCGEIYDKGRRIEITFNVPNIAVIVNLVPIPIHHIYYSPLVELKAAYVYSNDSKGTQGLLIIKSVGCAVEEIITKLADYQIDYNSLNEERNFYKYQWKSCYDDEGGEALSETSKITDEQSRKILISERTRINLEYLYGKDNRVWGEAIAPIIEEIAQAVWLQRQYNTPEQTAPCEHNWLRRKDDGTYRCAVCDKTLEVDEEIPY